MKGGDWLRKVEELFVKRQQLLELRNLLSNKASLDTEESMLYTRTLVKLVLIEVELEGQQKEVRR